MSFPTTTYTLYLYWPALAVGEWDHGAYPVSECKRPICELPNIQTPDTAYEIREALLTHLRTLEDDQDALNRTAPNGLYGRTWQNVDILIEKCVAKQTRSAVPVKALI